MLAAELLQLQQENNDMEQALIEIEQEKSSLQHQIQELKNMMPVCLTIQILSKSIRDNNTCTMSINSRDKDT